MNNGYDYNQQPQQPTYYQQQPNPYYPQSPYLRNDLPSGGNMLAFGIVSIVLSALSAIPYFLIFGIGVAGIIFGAIGLSMKKKYVTAGVYLTGTAKAGAILSKIGLIVGIAITSFWVIYLGILLIIYLFAFLASGASELYY